MENLNTSDVSTEDETKRMINSGLIIIVFALLFALLAVLLAVLYHEDAAYSECCKIESSLKLVAMTSGVC